MGITGDAGGIDVLVFFTFTLLAHSHPFFPFFPYRSMLLFLASILSFVWLTGSGNDPSLRAPFAMAVLGPRVAVTGVLVLGLVFLAMIVKTLMRYGRECEMRPDAEMSLGAVSVQRREPEERGRERKEMDRGRDGERSTRRRGGGAGRHVEEEQ